MPAPTPETSLPLAAPPRARAGVLLCAGLIAAAGLAAYHNSLHGPFIFDDSLAISENPSIRGISEIGAVLDPRRQVATAQGRPVLNLSLALNYAAGGLDPAGYHYANLLIHVAAGLVLFGIVRQTLLLPSMRPRFGDAALPLALATAVVWTVHPLQTEAVTYTIQRAESLMGLFYLLTLYCFIRGILVPRPAGWWAAAVGSCLLGMGTKEVMVSAPVIVLLYDRAFFCGTFRDAWRRHGPVIAALAGTWLLLGYLVASGGGNRGGSVGFGVRTRWWAYELTQGEAIVRYLRLSVWPHPLVLSYGTFWVTGALEAALWTLPVLLLIAGILAACRRSPALGFLGLWFLAILAPTSLVPGTTQMIVEHRMYLALAAVVCLGVTGAYALLGRRSLWIWPAVAAGFCWLTVQRNRDYRSEEAIWADTVRKSPLDAVAHYNLGYALQAQAPRSGEAIEQFRESLRLNPDNPDTHDCLGVLLARQPGRLPEAIAQFREAIRLNPGDARALNNLGLNITGMPGGLPEAIADLREAERLDPGSDEIRVNLGFALAQLPDLPGAEAQYREAIRLNPTAVAFTDLGALLKGQPARQEEAAAAYREAIRLDPGSARAHNDLGLVLYGLPGRMAEAVRELQESVRIDPSRPSAHCNLGVALAGVPGREAEAVAELREAIRLGPDQLEAHFNLGMLLAGGGARRAEAAAQFDEVLRIRPGFEPALQMLGQLRGTR
ncbi:MAG TPA: tetratricopeptide repeat protein [Opitutaceae bacterium]|nr:tetratricopeptide repeat protein [Opitutaceae bacterium]